MNATARVATGHGALLARWPVILREVAGSMHDDAFPPGWILRRRFAPCRMTARGASPRATRYSSSRRSSPRDHVFGPSARARACARGRARVTR